jgi:uncharacterized membrane protein (UPF0127 family)
MGNRRSVRCLGFLLLLAFVLLLSGSGKGTSDGVTGKKTANDRISGNTVLQSINGRPLRVEVARTSSARKKGLMHRESLGKNEGMLFVFESDQILSFWMKDTSISLSVAFLEKNGKVTDIFDMEPYSRVPVRSSIPCRYAIEANRDFFSEAGLEKGDTVDLDIGTLK